MTTKTNKPKPPKIVQCPIDGVPYLTKGKNYEVFSIVADYDDRYGYVFGVIDDDGYKIVALEKECSHLDNANWIIIEREP